jgi:hypothetical protein
MASRSIAYVQTALQAAKRRIFNMSFDPRLLIGSNATLVEKS